jgi:hypothetical protein
MRIDPIDPADADERARIVLQHQTETWGAPLPNHLLYARRPTIFRGVRSMWTGIDASGLIDEQLKALLNRRVASLNGCPF